MFLTIVVGYVILVALALTFVKVVYSVPAINPFSISLMSILPVEISKVLIGPYANGIVGDPYYLKAASITLVYFFLVVMAWLFWSWVFSRLKVPIFSGAGVNYLVRKSAYKKLSFVFFALYVLFFLVTAMVGGGGELWLTNSRHAYQFHRVGAGVFFALSITFLSLSYVFGVVSCKKAGPRIYIIIFLFTGISFFFGTKGVMLQFAVFGLVALWFYRSKGLYVFCLVVPVAVFPAMLYSLYQAYDGLSVRQIFGYFDHYSNSAMFYKAYSEGGIDFFWGKIWLSEFWSLVPRIVYPDKPFVYGFLHVNEFFYPGMAADTHTPAFGGPTDLYADFGLLGVFLGSVLSPLAIGWAFGGLYIARKFRGGIACYGEMVDARFVVLLVFMFGPAFLIYFNTFAQGLFFLFVVALTRPAAKMRLVSSSAHRSGV